MKDVLFIYFVFISDTKLAGVYKERTGLRPVAVLQRHTVASLPPYAPWLRRTPFVAIRANNVIIPRERANFIKKLVACLPMPSYSLPPKKCGFCGTWHFGPLTASISICKAFHRIVLKSWTPKMSSALHSPVSVAFCLPASFACMPHWGYYIHIFSAGKNTSVFFSVLFCCSASVSG